MYVVWVEEHLRDGREDWAKVYGTLDAALGYIAELADSFFAPGFSYRLFHLGEEIPLTQETVETPQPAKTQTRYVLAKTPKRGNPTEGPK
jgi:hypothetical protein